MGDTGLELPANSAGNPGVPVPGGSNSGNTGAPSVGPAGAGAAPADDGPAAGWSNTVDDDAGLAALAAAWPGLAPMVRVGILAMVTAALGAAGRPGGGPGEGDR